MSEPNLDQYRKQIAEIDDEIIELLVKRFELTDSIGVFKKKRKMDIENKEVENILKSLKEQRIAKYLKVGFTQEQAELLAEEIKMAGLGFGGIF